MLLNSHQRNTEIDLDHFVTALATVSEGLMIFDKELNILYKNVASEYILGNIQLSFKKEDFLQWKKKFRTYDLKTQKELDYDELPILRAISGLKYTDYQVQIVSDESPTGIYLSCNGTPLIGKNDTIIGCVFTFSNITKRYMAEKTLTQEKAFYKNIIDWIPAGVFVYDDVDNYYFTNHKGDEIHKEIEKQGWIPGQKVTELIKDHDALVMKKLEVMEFDEYIDFPNGRRSYRTIRFPIYHQSAQKLLKCSIAFDVTEKLAMEQKLENERVNSINASKLSAIGTLAGEIGHEINNPITILSSLVFIIRELAQDKKLTNDYLFDKLNVMDATLKRVSGIVKSLKNLSRKSTNESKESCVLRHIISDVIALSDLKFSSAGIKFIYDAKAPVLDESIECYQIQFSQVLMNLLTNAADAITGTHAPLISLNASEDKESIFISVKDSGAGVPDEIKNRIFEPFFTTKGVGKGTGLGLSISKNIMEAHGGDLYLAPKEEGSCFIVRLPKKSTT
jgi:signal transduction histidine kinase